ncbi:hypothetical protein ACFQ4C_07605 [Larkinella insperata]|uniref:Uncharacterized protein n=1 Tax=Larkinella insperata TaxID=332158 RepID=A0ABW3QGG1_9BACT
MSATQILNTSPLAATSQTWSLTNSSGVSVVVLDASSNPPSPTQQLFDQTLSWLTTADLLNTIPPRTTKTIPLPAAQLDDNGLPIDLTLILADAQTLAPLKVVDLPALNPAPATELTEADLTASKQAQEFVKTITAFPSSSLVTDYLKALDDPDPTALPAFFAATTDFKQVSLELVVAFQTYFNRFPFYLTGYTTARSFYLYSSDGTTNRYAGSVVLQNQSTAPSSVPNAIEGLEAMYVTTNGADYIPLSYVDGQFVDDPNSASPDYCLRGLFMLRSDLTKLDTDTDIMPLVWGRVNGQTVFGYDVKQEKAKVKTSLENTQSLSAIDDDDPLDDPKNQPSGFSLDALIHPRTTQDKLILSGMVVGGVIVVGILGTAAYFLIKWLSRNSPMTPKQIQAKNQEIREQNRVRRQATLDKIGARVEIQLDTTSTLAEIKTRGNELLINDNKLKVNDMLKAQRTICDILNDLGTNVSLTEMYTTIDSLAEKVETLDVSELSEGTAMKSLMGDVNLNMAKVLAKYVSLKDNLQGANADMARTAESKLLKTNNEITNNEKTRKYLQEDTIPDIPELVEG